MIITMKIKYETENSSSDLYDMLEEWNQKKS